MKEEKELEVIEKPKKNKGVIFGFVFLILIILCMAGYILVDKGVIKLDDKKSNNNTKEEAQKEETPEELKTDDKLVVDNMKKIGGFSEKYYDKEKVTVDDLNNDDVLDAGIYLYAQENIVPSINYDDENLDLSSIKGNIDNKKLDQNIKEIFGAKIQYNDNISKTLYIMIKKGTIIEVNTNFSYKLRGLDIGYTTASEK